MPDTCPTVPPACLATVSCPPACPPPPSRTLQDSSCERLTELALNDGDVACTLLRQALRPCCVIWGSAQLKEGAAAFQRVRGPRNRCGLCRWVGGGGGGGVSVGGWWVGGCVGGGGGVRLWGSVCGVPSVGFRLWGSVQEACRVAASPTGHATQREALGGPGLDPPSLHLPPSLQGLKAALDAANTIKGLMEMMFDVITDWIHSFIEVRVHATLLASVSRVHCRQSDRV